MSTNASRKGSTSDNEKEFVTGRSTVDEAAMIASDDDSEIDPEVADRLRRKIDRHIMPLMMSEFNMVSYERYDSFH